MVIHSPFTILVILFHCKEPKLLTIIILAGKARQFSLPIMPISKQQEVKPPEKTLYFAYGSNLQLKQMATRCPKSKYIGRARLNNYRWQINERGFANVVPSRGLWVEGLVYELNGNDEARLDRNEGVSKEAYNKTYETVHLYRPPSYIYRRPTAWIVARGGPDSIRLHYLDKGKRWMEQPAADEPNVLVYASLLHVKNSLPREEYVHRVNLGIDDACALGMDRDYIHNFVKPVLCNTTVPTLSQAVFSKPSTRGREATHVGHGRAKKRSASSRRADEVRDERVPGRVVDFSGSPMRHIVVEARQEVSDLRSTFSRHKLARTMGRRRSVSEGTHRVASYILGRESQSPDRRR